MALIQATKHFNHQERQASKYTLEVSLVPVSYFYLVKHLI